MKTILSQLLCSSFLCYAQETLVNKPPARTVIHASHLLDVKSGRMLDNVTLVIDGDKITSVGQAAAGTATVINLPNATLLPGLIDSHTHLTGEPSFGYQELGISTPMEALIGAKNARVTLEAGFTTVRNVGAGAYTDVALRDAIDQGLVPGPHMIVSGPPAGHNRRTLR